MSYKSPENNLGTDDTNMLISVLANTEKLKDAKELYHYGDEQVHNDAEEKLDDYVEAPPQHYTEQNQTYPQEEVNEEPKQDYNKFDGSYTTLQQPAQLQVPAQKEEIDEYDTASPMRKKLMKLDMVRKLAELTEKGVVLTQNYNMESDFKVMKYEWELHTKIREKHNTVLFLRDGCLSLVEGAETVNRSYFNKFGLELDGWSDKVNKKSEQLYDVFGDLYENWGGPNRKMPPELMLCGILGLSAVKTHMINKALKGKDMNEQINTNRDKYEDIRNQAMGETMKTKMDKQSPVFQEKLTKQYDQARQNVQKYEELREDEEEYNQMKITPPIIPESLARQNMGSKEQEMSYQMMREQQERMMDTLNPVNPTMMTTKQFNEFRKGEILEQKEKFEQRLAEQKRNIRKRGSMDEVSQHSTDSIIRKNPDYDSILKDAEIMSSNSSKVCKKRGRKPKKKDSVKLDM